MLQEVYQHFQSIFGIYFTAQMTSLQEQIMPFPPVNLCFESFFKSCERRKLLSEWGFYKMKVATNLLHKEEDMLIATSVSSELSMTFQIVKE